MNLASCPHGLDRAACDQCAKEERRRGEAAERRDEFILDADARIALGESVTCVACGQPFADGASLYAHYDETGHIRLTRRERGGRTR